MNRRNKAFQKGKNANCLSGWHFIISIFLILVFFLLSKIPPVWAKTTGQVTAERSVLSEYDPAVRPNSLSGPTTVSVEIYLYDFVKISDIDTSFTVDYFLRLKWHDHRLARASKGIEAKIALDEVWNPRLITVNQRDLTEVFDDVVSVSSRGEVTYIQRYKGSLSFDHNLKEFPFDSHVVPIKFMTRGYGPDQVVLKPGELVTQRRTFSIVDWKVGRAKARSGVIHIEETDLHFSAFFYEIPVSRHPEFYIWKVIVPLSMIVFMSWGVFFIDTAQIGPRIGLSTASILTLILFQFHLGRLVPWVPYFTRADRFSTGAILLVFMALAEAILGSAIIKRDREALSVKIEWWSRIVFPAVFILLLIFSLLM